MYNCGCNGLIHESVIVLSVLSNKVVNTFKHKIIKSKSQINITIFLHSKIVVRLFKKHWFSKRGTSIHVLIKRYKLKVPLSSQGFMGQRNFIKVFFLSTKGSLLLYPLQFLLKGNLLNKECKGHFGGDTGILYITIYASWLMN